MSKWVSYGYAPTSDPESNRIKREEDDLLRDHLPIILDNSDKILRTPTHFYCQLGTAFVSSPWVFGGGGPIPLGVLILLWERGDMVFDCPSCGGRLYVVGIFGSVLSGCGSAWGPCLDCSQDQHIRQDHMGRLILFVGSLLRTYRNEPVIERGEQQHFDWKFGLVGEYKPDRVIVTAVEPWNLRTLIEEFASST